MLTINDDVEAQVWGAVYAAVLHAAFMSDINRDSGITGRVVPQVDADAAVLALRERRKAVAK